MISGPIIEPSSGLPPKQLIIFVHGYGADGNDLIGLASYFQSVLPDAIFLSPHAPEACSMNPAGYQWFDLTSTDPAVLWNKILVAADHLNEFIDAKLLEYNLSEENLALVGFSQGTMMSLHVGLRRNKPMGAVLGYSGKLIGAELLKTDLISKPSIYLIHGDQDPMVPCQETLSAETALKEYGVDVTTHISKDTQHSIAEDGLRIGVDFLKARL
jgi:phospholipase/carboxylesterase